ncbi:MAG: TrmH family RNA methyltransferase, partial [Gaiellaceae bacterium]
MTRELVYGRRPVREVLRAGRRQILELLVTERALAAEPWLREVAGLRLQVHREGGLTEAAQTRDHQGVVAFCEPYRYVEAHEVAAGGTPLVVCLDQVTDPHNLGAVCRSAEGAAASGVVV